MKNPKKQELNLSSIIAFQNFVMLYKKCATKTYSFLVTDTTLASDYPSCFRKNLVERIRNSPPEVFLGKSVLKLCRIFTGEHPY